MDAIHDASAEHVAAIIADIPNTDNGNKMPLQQDTLPTNVAHCESVTTATDIVDKVKQEPQHQIIASTTATESGAVEVDDKETDSTLFPMVDLLTDNRKINSNGGCSCSDIDSINNDTNTSVSSMAKTDIKRVTSQDKELDSNALNGESGSIIDEISSAISIDPTKVHDGETDVISSMSIHENNISKNIEDGNSEIVASLQENLQYQMSAKAEAEEKVRKLESKARLLEDQIQKQADEKLKLDTIQENLQLQMNAKAEAEHKARSAYDRVQQLEGEKEKCLQELNETQQQISESREVMVNKDRELDRVRTERDELERKVTALTTRLNAAKKLEAVKVNHVDEIEDDLKVTSDELREVKFALEQNISTKHHLEQQLRCVETVSREQIELLESSLAEEKRLNEERKQKMKEYVDKKTEELKQAKEENDSLQMELSQNNRSLVELNTRWKQIHTQWVQAQTRNRELQRDLQRTKKDSEHLHKQGDSLEMKLSRSANETEEHKNKRLAAKQELMSVLRALETEREITTKLRDQIKFSFVPKMLNQQQTLNEILNEFNAALEKLSLRLGKPLLPLSEESDRNAIAKATTTNGSYNDSVFSQSNLNPIVEKLDNESQKVSNAITAVLNNVERLRALVQASGDRTCFTVLSELVHTGGMESSPAIQADRARNQLQAAIGQSHRYGQIPGTSD